jgi:hypothetical protein
MTTVRRTQSSRPRPRRASQRALEPPPCLAAEQRLEPAGVEADRDDDQVVCDALAACAIRCRCQPNSTIAAVTADDAAPQLSA